MPMLRNKRTGETVFVPDQPGMTQIAPPDPRLPAQVTGAQLSNQKTVQDIATSAAKNPWEIRATRAAALKDEAELEKLKAGTTLTPDKLKAVRVDALNKIILARKLKNRSAKGWFATGFLAPTMAGIGGTDARGVQAGADTLKAGGALAEVLKLTEANGGKNPFQPMSNSDVELIARNTANLDIGQPDADFQSALDQYESAYRRGFIGAKGSPKALEDALIKLGLGKPRKTSSKPSSDDGWKIEEVR